MDMRFGIRYRAGSLETVASEAENYK